jgi:L-iditol 2-dehydrogenase
MRQAVLYGVHDVRIEQAAPPPPPSSNEVQLRILTVGLCESDAKYFFDGGVSEPITHPFVLGHEASGQIVATGPEVDSFAVGEIVSIEPGVPCGQCKFCRRGRYNLCENLYFMASRSHDGALRERLNWPASWVHHLPPRLTPTEGSLLEPLSVAIAAVESLGHVAGGHVGVFGSGSVGLLCIQVLRAFGASRIMATDVEPGRLERASGYGAEVARPGRGANLLSPGSLDAAIDTTGSPEAIRAALSSVTRGGTLALVGLGSCPLALTPTEVVYSALQIVGVYRYAHTFPLAADLVDRGLVDVKGLVTGTFSLADVSRALEAVHDKAHQIKVIVKVSPEQSSHG